MDKIFSKMGVGASEARIYRKVGIFQHLHTQTSYQKLTTTLNLSTIYDSFSIENVIAEGIGAQSVRHLTFPVPIWR